MTTRRRKNPKAKRKPAPRSLEECSGQEEVAEELSKGNEALQEDVDEKLEELSRAIGRGRGSWEPVEHDPWWQDDWVREQIVKHVEEALSSSMSADAVEQLKKSGDLERAVRYALPNSKFDRNSNFSLEEYRRGEIVADSPNESEFWVSLDEDTEGKIPSDLVKAVLQEHFSERDGREWYEHGSSRGEPTITNGWSIVVQDGDYHVCISEDNWNELLHDIRSKYYSELIDKDLESAKKALLKELEVEVKARAFDKELYERLVRLAPQIPDEEWGNFCVVFLTENALRMERNERTEEAIQEFLDLLEAPPIEETDPSRLVGVIEWPPRAKLDQLKEEDRPPWRVIRLSPGELAREGTALRHCVGKKEMGYVRALAKGEIEIWSVRMPTNKPIFTMEVDASINESKPRGFSDEDFARARGGCIKQVRGKANRTPGSSGLKEVKRLARFFESVNVDPNAVRDMIPGLEHARFGAW